MKKKTLVALKGSIEKWEKIVAGKGKDRGTENCPLCKLFWAQKQTCQYCPVERISKRGCCENTPYDAWNVWKENTEKDRVVDKQSKQLAQAELDFLKSLLPENEK